MKPSWHRVLRPSRVVPNGPRHRHAESRVVFPLLFLIACFFCATPPSLAADTTYPAWARQHFGAAVDDPAQEPTLWGPNADPDHDGRPNLMEYALGNNPLSGADAGAGLSVELKPSAAGGPERYLHATVIVRINDPMLLVVPQVSSGGTTWQEGSSALELLATEPVHPGFARIAYRDVTPVTPGQPRFFRVRVCLDTDDTDGDGLPDSWERFYFGNLDHDGTEDSDHDGLTNLQEYHAGTDPTKPDTDGDGMPDGWEVLYHLAPLVNDSALDLDADGVINSRDARPDNPTVGALKITITTPSNGSTIP